MERHMKAEETNYLIPITCLESPDSSDTDDGFSQEAKIICGASRFPPVAPYYSNEIAIAPYSVYGSGCASSEFDDNVSDWSLKLKYLEAKLKEIAGSKKRPLLSSRCIYKVPPKLRKVNEEAYTPNVVSIGPYHHNGDRRLESMHHNEDRTLESMQGLKVWYVNRFLSRSPKNSKDYCDTLISLEDKIRCSYSETIPMESDEFLSMILTDACFIIEFFLERLDDKARLLVENLWQREYIQIDLILLENQIPFLVLTHLFKLAFPGGVNGKHSFVDLTYDFFKLSYLPLIYPDKKACCEFKRRFDRTILDQAKHLCDVFRIFYLPASVTELQCSGKVLEIPLMNHSYSVTQLDEAGMKFEAAAIERRVTELQCSGTVLKIPGILMHDWTETMLRNVVALEQCHYPLDGYVTDYAFLLDKLINTEKDVEILVRKGIMENMLGDSNVVASMLNTLCNNVLLTNTNSHYISLYKEMRIFCDNTYHKNKAIFFREYWSTPWKKLSLLAATLLLVLTFIQTIFSVI